MGYLPFVCMLRALAWPGMGSFLDKPVTEKHTEVFEDCAPHFRGAVSEMQGWRVDMEVRPECCDGLPRAFARPR